MKSYFKNKGKAARESRLKEEDFLTIDTRYEQAIRLLTLNPNKAYVEEVAVDAAIEAQLREEAM